MLPVNHGQKQNTNKINTNKTTTKKYTEMFASDELLIYEVMLILVTLTGESPIVGYKIYQTNNP